ncbi:ankyrin repeat domain-containing protein [Paenibacillus contaminans]|uniref:Ankyrin repeat domain-containing protein n=1 Tax=Paenibacillus contaminans TaxID=450362 RepID=A0A329MNJ4_9BACL|nr:ankyrin repeat domain-containing protein [Paenibacillus contaminans]RAV21140.1 ankyrin repeat domain-containing protein [Paenibacillus contaminans]
MENKQAIQPDLVKDFVGNAHGDLERVKQLLEQEPGLVNAAWDWGNGDWETALGAAAHMGRKDIAIFLLENGARIDLFAAAMLGKAEIVKAMLADNPSLKDAIGPHGIPLINHARAGGDESLQVLDLLS